MPLASGTKLGPYEILSPFGVWHATFTSSANGYLIFQKGAAMAQSRMEWVDRSGKHLGFVGDKDVFLGPRLSKDGRRLLVGLGDPTHDVWAFNTSGLDKTRLTFDGDVVAEPVWSPDSTRFAVVHGLPNSISRAAVRPASGSGDSVNVNDVHYNFAVADWSSDGRYLLTESADGNLDMIPLNPGEQPRRVFTPTNTTGPGSSGQFSPDGKFIAVPWCSTPAPRFLFFPHPVATACGRSRLLEASGPAGPAMASSFTSSPCVMK